MKKPATRSTFGIGHNATAPVSHMKRDASGLSNAHTSFDFSVGELSFESTHYSKVATAAAVEQKYPLYGILEQYLLGGTTASDHYFSDDSSESSASYAESLLEDISDINEQESNATAITSITESEVRRNVNTSKSLEVSEIFCPKHDAAVASGDSLRLKTSAAQRIITKQMRRSQVLCDDAMTYFDEALVDSIEQCGRRGGDCRTCASPRHYVCGVTSPLYSTSYGKRKKDQRKLVSPKSLNRKQQTSCNRSTKNEEQRERVSPKITNSVQLEQRRAVEISCPQVGTCKKRGAKTRIQSKLPPKKGESDKRDAVDGRRGQSEEKREKSERTRDEKQPSKSPLIVADRFLKDPAKLETALQKKLDKLNQRLHQANIPFEDFEESHVNANASNSFEKLLIEAFSKEELLQRLAPLEHDGGSIASKSTIKSGYGVRQEIEREPVIDSFISAGNPALESEDKALQLTNSQEENEIVFETTGADSAMEKDLGEQTLWNNENLWEVWTPGTMSMEDIEIVESPQSKQIKHAPLLSLLERDENNGSILVGSPGAERKMKFLGPSISKVLSPMNSASHRESIESTGNAPVRPKLSWLAKHQTTETDHIRVHRILKKMVTPHHQGKTKSVSSTGSSSTTKRIMELLSSRRAAVHRMNEEESSRVNDHLKNMAEMPIEKDHRISEKDESEKIVQISSEDESKKSESQGKRDDPMNSGNQETPSINQGSTKPTTPADETHSSDEGGYHGKLKLIKNWSIGSPQVIQTAVKVPKYDRFHSDDPIASDLSRDDHGSKIEVFDQFISTSLGTEALPTPAFKHEGDISTDFITANEVPNICAEEAIDDQNKLAGSESIVIITFEDGVEEFEIERDANIVSPEEGVFSGKVNDPCPIDQNVARKEKIESERHIARGNPGLNNTPCPESGLMIKNTSDERETKAESERLLKGKNVKNQKKRTKLNRQKFKPEMNVEKKSEKDEIKNSRVVLAPKEQSAKDRSRTATKPDGKKYKPEITLIMSEDRKYESVSQLTALKSLYDSEGNIVFFDEKAKPRRLDVEEHKEKHISSKNTKENSNSIAGDKKKRTVRRLRALKALDPIRKQFSKYTLDSRDAATGHLSIPSITTDKLSTDTTEDHVKLTRSFEVKTVPPANPGRANDSWSAPSVSLSTVKKLVQTLSAGKGLAADNEFNQQHYFVENSVSAIQPQSSYKLANVSTEYCFIDKDCKSNAAVSVACSSSDRQSRSGLKKIFGVGKVFKEEPPNNIAPKKRERKNRVIFKDNYEVINCPRIHYNTPAVTVANEKSFECRISSDPCEDANDDMDPKQSEKVLRALKSYALKKRSRVLEKRLQGTFSMEIGSDTTVTSVKAKTVSQKTVTSKTAASSETPSTSEVRATSTVPLTSKASIASQTSATSKVTTTSKTSSTSKAPGKTKATISSTEVRKTAIETTPLSKTDNKRADNVALNSTAMKSRRVDISSDIEKSPSGKSMASDATMLTFEEQKVAQRLAEDLTILTRIEKRRRKLGDATAQAKIHELEKSMKLLKSFKKKEESKN